MREELQAKYNRLMKYSDGSNNEDDQALVANQGFKQKVFEMRKDRTQSSELSIRTEVPRKLPLLRKTRTQNCGMSQEEER